MKDRVIPKFFKKQVSRLLIVALVAQYGFAVGQSVSFAEGTGAETVIDQTIASGIQFHQTNYTNYKDSAGNWSTETLKLKVQTPQEIAVSSPKQNPKGKTN